MSIYNSDYMNDLIRAMPYAVGIEKLRNKKILITGASGLIGSALVDFLVAANNIMHLETTIYAGIRNADTFSVRFSGLEDGNDLVYFPYDALLPIEPDIHFDFIIHAASKANPSAYMQKPVETMLSNFNGVYHALEYAKHEKNTIVLYISSSEVYGKKDGNSPYTENDYAYLDILNPRSCYPSSKRAAESLCVSYYVEYGIPSIIVRPGHIYGPTATSHDTRVSSLFPLEVAKGNNIIMKSAGNQLRSYCYVVDCVTAVLTVLCSGERGTAYNVSNRNSVCSIRQMAGFFAKAGDCEVIFANPSESEKKGYNLMDNSSLDACRLEGLGWKALFDMDTGAKHTLSTIKSKIQDDLKI